MGAQLRHVVTPVPLVIRAPIHRKFKKNCLKHSNRAQKERQLELFEPLIAS